MARTGPGVLPTVLGAGQLAPGTNVPNAGTNAAPPAAGRVWAVRGLGAGAELPWLPEAVSRPLCGHGTFVRPFDPGLGRCHAAR